MCARVCVGMCMCVWFTALANLQMPDFDMLLYLFLLFAQCLCTCIFVCAHAHAYARTCMCMRVCVCVCVCVRVCVRVCVCVCVSCAEVLSLLKTWRWLQQVSSTAGKPKRDPDIASKKNK